MKWIAKNILPFLGIAALREIMAECQKLIDKLEKK